MAEDWNTHELRSLFNENFVTAPLAPRPQQPFVYVPPTVQRRRFNIEADIERARAIARGTVEPPQDHGEEPDVNMAHIPADGGAVAQGPGPGNAIALGQGFIAGSYANELNYQIEQRQAIQREGIQPWQYSAAQRAVHDEVRVELMDVGNPPTLYLLPHPQPVAAYMQLAKLPAGEITFKKTLLIVLDLNGTLLARKTGSTSFTPRPHLEHFLQYALANHKVVIWSSAKPQNVYKMVNRLIPADQRHKVLQIWTRDHLRLGNHYNQKVQVYKQLSWLWNDAGIQNSFKPEFGGYRWDQTNTVLIDDTIEKAASEPYNLLKIDEFSITEDTLKVDVLGQVAAFLERLCRYDNVSACMHEGPYRTYLEENAGTFDWASLARNEG